MNRKIVKVFGSDSEVFLQNLISNNLKLCTHENPIYSCLLSPKGRYQFDFFVIRIEDYFLIDIFESKIEAFLSALKYRKLIAKVSFEILENFKVYNTKSKIDNAIVSYKDPRLDVLGYRSISIDELQKDLLLLNYNKIRYQNTIPESEDFNFDKSIPIEFGMDELGALSYNKGCYLGQEFTNSAKNRMAIRKRLISISTNSPLVKGDILVNEAGDEVGKVVSVLNRQLSLDATTLYKDSSTDNNPTITSNLALALFKMAHKDENIFINGKPVKTHIPSWIKVYSME